MKTLLYLFNAVVIDCADAADTDDSEDVDITDAIYTLDFIFRGGPPPAVPFPTEGEDPDGEALGCER